LAEGTNPNVRAGMIAEGLFLLAAALIVGWQILIPPIVGLADNGDFPRVMSRFNIGYPPGIFAESQFKYLVRQYEIRPRHFIDYGFRTSENLFVRVSLVVNRIFFGKRSYDIRTLGAVHLVAFLLCLIPLVWLSRPWPAAVRWTLLIATLLTFADTAYVAFFNSFYSETASLLFLLATIGAALLMFRRESFWTIALFTFTAIGLAFAKPQHAVAGWLLGLLLLRFAMIARRRIPRRTAIGGAVLVFIFSTLAFKSAPGFLRDWSYEIAVLWEIMGHSPDPAADARALGLDADLVRYSGMHPWSPGIPPIDDLEFRAAFLDKISFVDVVTFYLRSPRRTWSMFNRVTQSALRTRPGRLGNYERIAGFEPAARSHKFDLFSRMKERFIPRRTALLAAFLVAYSAALVAIWIRSRRAETRWIAEVIAVLVVIAVGEFLVVALTQGDFDAAKHLLMFRAVVDVLLIVALVAIIALIRSRVTPRMDEGKH
jgi:hypothetical protein